MLTCALEWVESHPGLASWLQGFFSLVAIGVAIWIPAQQRRNAQKRLNEREQQELHSMLLSIRDEVKVLWESYMETVGHRLTASKPGTPLTETVLFSERTFPVFNAYVGSLGRISNDDLRHQILITYARANSMLLAFSMNNGLIAKSRSEYRSMTPENAEVAVTHLRNANIELAKFGDDLRSISREVETQVRKLLDLLPAAGN